MSNQIIKYIFLLFFIFGGFTLLPAQETKLHVVTKTIEKKFDFSGKNSLVIKAEKGVISIMPSNTHEVSVVMKLIVKHPQKEVALKELEYANYSMNMAGKDLIFSNQMILPSSKPDEIMEVAFRAEYVIAVPQNIKIEITNNFGSVSLDKLNAEIKANLEYCDLFCSELSGIIEVDSYIGDLKFNDLNSKVNIVSKYSEINFLNPLDINTIKAEYGKVNIVFSERFPLLNITTDGANVALYNKNCVKGGFVLNTKNGKLYINEDCYLDSRQYFLIQKDGSVQKAEYKKSGIPSEIHIETNFSDVSLN